MKLANLLFYFLLFVGFFLPTNGNMYIPLPGVYLKVNELAFILLPIVNLFCTSKNKRFRLDRKLAKYIVLYLIVVFITEFLFKPIAFDQSFGDSFKSFRLGLPLYSSLVLIYSGIRADIKVVWKILLVAVGISVILSIISVFVSLPIYYNVEEEDLLNVFQGRILNSNAPFGIIGLYLIFADKNKWYNQGKLVLYISILSIIALIISFNRTYLFLIVLEFLYLSYITFSKKTFYKIILYPVFSFMLLFYGYNNVDIVQRQIDKRILSILFQETSLAESTIDGNRDVIYAAMATRIEEGYWLIGMPYNIPIYIKDGNYERNDIAMKITDTSFVNILLNYGFFPLILFLLIYHRLYKIVPSKIYKFLLILFLLASLNIDSLMRHNSIFFLIILFIIINRNPNAKSSFYSQNRLKYRR